jgi:hypothetical protein
MSDARGPAGDVDALRDLSGAGGDARASRAGAAGGQAGDAAHVGADTRTADVARNGAAAQAADAAHVGADARTTDVARNRAATQAADAGHVDAAADSADLARAADARTRDASRTDAVAQGADAARTHAASQISDAALAAVRARAIESWLATLPREPIVVRVGTRAAVAGLEDRIAQVDDLLTSVRLDGTYPDRLAALQQERVRLVGSLAQVRYAEVVASESP